MAGIKRKEASGDAKAEELTKSKKMKPSKPQKLKTQPIKKTIKRKPETEFKSLIESDTSETENGFYGFSAEASGPVADVDMDGSSGFESDEEGGAVAVKPTQKLITDETRDLGSRIPNGTTSKEAHAKQKALAKERKAAKPNADMVQRSKKIWERLRRKSHVPPEERKQLVTELFEIVTGRVKEFVFKHDSVRVIQCAVKYANAQQRKMLAKELKGEYRALAESKYAKFLIGKLLVEGDDEIRDMILPEFYGHVRRLINHPEASWILDDIYRVKATSAQRATILREWYGPEFAIFKSATKEKLSANLSDLLVESPEKRKPIMSHLYNLINQLIQKKLTGFTMLHDGMLQYFLCTSPGSEEHTAFLDLLKDDEEGDLLKNLAFTKSGARVVCLALAYCSAKDRRNILRVYKDNVETLAFDPNGHLVLLAAYDVIDDTVTVAKLTFNELLAISAPAETQQEKILALVTHPLGRITLLYPLAGQAKWLVNTETQVLLKEIHGIRATTSKKDPQVRQSEHIKAISELLLSTVAAHAATLAETSFGCQFMTETLFSAPTANAIQVAAVGAIVDLASGDPKEDGHISRSAAGGRMLKSLVLGGRFDSQTKGVIACDPPLELAPQLYEKIKPWIVDWACGSSSFVVVNLLEANDFDKKAEVMKQLKKDRKRLEKAAQEETEEQKAAKEERATANGSAEASARIPKKKKAKREAPSVGNVGTRLLLEKLA